MLRITSGEYRNRKLDVPETGKIRPMLEKPRQAIFSILMQDVVAGETVIDCFAGSGILGFECLSRGAAHAVFYDTDRKHLEAIASFAEKLGCDKQIRTTNLDVMRSLVPGSPLAIPGGGGVKLIFLDPPHAMSNDKDHLFWRWFEELADCKFVGPDTIVVFGHHAHVDTPETLGQWNRFCHRTYGKVALSFFDLHRGVEESSDGL